MQKNKSPKNKSQIKEEKLKSLSPTLRLKKRFIKVQIQSSKKIDFKEFSENITEQILTYLGAIEFGKAGVWILRDKFDEQKQTAILKVSTKTKDKLIGALSLIQKIGNTPCTLKTLRTSGTLKGVEKITNKKN